MNIDGLQVFLKMNKVLYIGGFELPDKNAAAHRVLANAKLLREMGWNVSFIGVSKDVNNAPSDVCGFKSTPILYPTGIMDWVHQILIFVNMKTILGQNPDYVVLYNFPSIASLRILKECHKNGIKVIEDLTEWEEPQGWSFRSIIRKLDVKLRMEYCVKKMDGVIAISKFLFTKYKPYTETVLVPPLVDLEDEKWNRINISQIAPNKVSLVYAGNAGFGKKDRLDYIIEALDGITNVQLSVIGMTKDQYEQGYNKIVPKDIDVVFYGRLSHEETLKAVKKADFQMLIRDDNRKNNAGFPTKLVESMACGTPVIATLTSNIGDYLKDGYNCFIVSKDKDLKVVFSSLSNMSKTTINEMKQHCLDCLDFDYHNYKDEFLKLFK